LLIAVYSSVFMKRAARAKQFYAYFLFSIGLVNGAALADNLAALLFFWEGLLITLFGMIAIGRSGAFKTATKMFVIVGASDLCLMAGMAMCMWMCGTLTISKIHVAPGGFASLAFILLMIGAIAKAGSMPFHTWIPDAAIDAPLPFMAILPAALEKLIGIYFLARISLDLFTLERGSWLSTLLMSVGSITILLAVMMALIQKDYKRLLSYHAISQVGYMVLGIGTLVPAGIVGGLFHMLNNALYKSGLFLTGGAVEREAGTTDLEKIGGLGAKMPVTFLCFVITAASISGVPPFNGFFSKELVYDGALERGFIFYLAALAGSFFTAASFLKLGHAAFLGTLKEECRGVREAPLAMLAPMILIAVTCAAFGLWSAFPLGRFIEPMVGGKVLEGRTFAHFHLNAVLVAATVAVLAGSLVNHLYGFRRTGSGLKAVDHLHYAPVLSAIYRWAEKGYFDPYGWGLGIVRIAAQLAWWSDRVIDLVYNRLAVGAAYALAFLTRRATTGNYRTYIVWSLAGTLAVMLFLLKPQ